MNGLSVCSLRPAILAVALTWLPAIGCVSSNNGATSPDAAAETSSAPAEARPASTTSSGEVTDAQLDQFARISQKIHQVRMQTEKKLQTANSEKEATQIKKKAYRQIQTIFRDAEMTEQQYQAIGRRLKSNPGLRKRLKKKLETQE